MPSCAATTPRSPVTWPVCAAPTPGSRGPVHQLSADIVRHSSRGAVPAARGARASTAASSCPRTSSPSTSGSRTARAPRRRGRPARRDDHGRARPRSGSARAADRGPGAAGAGRAPRPRAPGRARRGRLGAEQLAPANPRSLVLSPRRSPRSPAGSGWSTSRSAERASRTTGSWPSARWPTTVRLTGRGPHTAPVERHAVLRSTGRSHRRRRGRSVAVVGAAARHGGLAALHRSGDGAGHRSGAARSGGAQRRRA